MKRIVFTATLVSTLAASGVALACDSCNLHSKPKPILGKVVDPKGTNRRYQKFVIPDPPRAGQVAAQPGAVAQPAPAQPTPTQPAQAPRAGRQARTP